MKNIIENINIIKNIKSNINEQYFNANKQVEQFNYEAQLT